MTQHDTTTIEGLPFDVDDISRALDSCETYLHDKSRPVQFQQEGIPLKPTPERGYTARMDVPVFVAGKDAGILHVCVFRPGDGTGSDRAPYRAENLIIPQSYQHEEKPWRVYPKKKDYIVEACIPLLTINKKGVTYLHTISLEQLAVDHNNNRTITRDWYIGSPPDEYSSAISRKGMFVETEPQIILTCGYRRTGERFGDPHAIYAPRGGVYDNVIQVAGFVAITDKNNPLCELFEEKGVTRTTERKK